LTRLCRPFCNYDLTFAYTKFSDYVYVNQTMSGFPFFLFHRAKMTMRLTEGVTRYRRPRFLLLETLVRECTFLTKSEAKERLLTVQACTNNFVFSLQVCLLSFIIVLHTVLYALPLVLVRRLRLTIKKCFTCSSFSQNLYD